MKTKTTTLFLTLFVLFSFTSIHAQLGNVIPKKDLVGSFNDFEDLGFSDDNSKKLKKQNESFVNDIFNIADSDKSDDEKKIGFKTSKKRKR